MMPKVLNFYLDDSGTRHPDHDPGKRAAHGYDWFALGGILVKEEDEDTARKLHKQFCNKWNIGDPIHSVEIRGCTGNFLWLMELSKTNRESFFGELYQLMRAVPAIGLSCVPFCEVAAHVVVGVDQLVERLLHLLIASRKL